jgi:molecular chaperone DnaK
MPAVEEKVRKLTGKEPGKSLNPDECVALGAAIQGGKIAGEAGLNEILLMVVTPLYPYPLRLQEVWLPA